MAYRQVYVRSMNRTGHEGGWFCNSDPGAQTLIGICVQRECEHFGGGGTRCMCSRAACGQRPCLRMRVVVAVCLLPGRDGHSCV